MTSSTDYDVRLAVRAVRRYWWIVLGLPLLALGIQVAQIRTATFRAEFRAVVILPGDTEIPGSSERPELMILDDVPQLVESTLFAERVAAHLSAEGATTGVESIDGALSASRNARTVTVVARDDEAERSELIAAAAESVFGLTVNEALVASGGPSATVTVIDPTGRAIRGEADQWMVAVIVAAAALFAGVLAALVVDGFREPGESG